MAEDAAPKFLGFIEKAIEKFGSCGFAVSKSVSYFFEVAFEPA